MPKVTTTLTPELAKFVSELAIETGQTETDIACQALSFYAEEQAVQKILRAAKEPTIDVDLTNLKHHY